MFSEHFELVVALKSRWIILCEAIMVEWNGEEFEIKGDVGKCVAVLNSAYYIRSAIFIVKLVNY